MINAFWVFGDQAAAFGGEEFLLKAPAGIKVGDVVMAKSKKGEFVKTVTEIVGQIDDPKFGPHDVFRTKSGGARTAPPPAVNSALFAAIVEWAVGQGFKMPAANNTVPAKASTDDEIPF